MKVILQRDVKGVGRAHEAVEAKDGYALNFLIPQKLAVPATPGAHKTASARAAKVRSRGEVATKLIEERLAYLADNSITLKKKANEQGHLYDAIDVKELAAASELPEEAIHIEKPFKELGTFAVPVALKDALGSFTIVIEGE